MDMGALPIFRDFLENKARFKGSRCRVSGPRRFQVSGLIGLKFLTVRTWTLKP